MDIKWPDACPLFFVEFFFFISAFHIWIPSLLFFFSFSESSGIGWIFVAKNFKNKCVLQLFWKYELLDVIL
jgi:hypothetical protein